MCNTSVKTGLEYLSIEFWNCCISRDRAKFSATRGGRVHRILLHFANKTDIGRNRSEGSMYKISNIFGRPNFKQKSLLFSKTYNGIQKDFKHIKHTFYLLGVNLKFFH